MIKPGTILESYQGRFAKVTAVKGTRFGLTAWFTKRVQAEEETRTVRFVNSFGLSQLVKPAETSAEATANQEGESTLDQMNHTELKARAKELGLSQAGKADDLRARIAEATANQEVPDAE